MTARIEADYLFETPIDPRRAADALAGEQSSGTFVAVPGETPELKARFAARVEALEVLGVVEAAALPGAERSGAEGFRRARATLSWPLDNIGPSLPNLMSTVAGNLFELKQVSALRLLDIRLPRAFVEAYPGPQFGVAGTRRLTGVVSGPIIGSIVKPSIGFDAKQTAALVATLCEAGVDFIKDDELQTDGASCRFADRLEAVATAIDRHADSSGKRVMFAFNLTGDLDQMRRRHDAVVARGGSCVMASLNSVGLVGMIELGRYAQVPIHAHRNGWGYLGRHPALGWSYVAWQKIWRLAGADHMHVNGLQSKFFESDESVLASARACLKPMFVDKPLLVMPVFSSGQTARQAEATVSGLGTSDMIVTAGGGIMAHPDGPGAGVASLRSAYEAALTGMPLDVDMLDRPATAKASALGPGQ